MATKRPHSRKGQGTKCGCWFTLVIIGLGFGSKQFNFWAKLFYLKSPTSIVTGCNCQHPFHGKTILITSTQSNATFTFPCMFHGLPYYQQYQPPKFLRQILQLLANSFYFVFLLENVSLKQISSCGLFEIQRERWCTMIKFYDSCSARINS